MRMQGPRPPPLAWICAQALEALSMPQAARSALGLVSAGAVWIMRAQAWMSNAPH
jgi:hypothetical protein